MCCMFSNVFAADYYIEEYMINIIVNEDNVLNIEEEIYIQYENGDIDIPASFIYELANIFKVDLGLLLTGEESKMTIFDVTRANKGVSVDRSKEYTHENLCSNFIHKKQLKLRMQMKFRFIQNQTL